MTKINLSEFVKLGKTAVLVIDAQNDYCSSEGFFSKSIGFDVSPIQSVIPKLKSFLDNCRKKKLPIIFTKMTEDQDHVPENLRKKMQTTRGGESFAKPGSWGHNFFEISPDPGELVIEKNQYDSFTNPLLEKHLRENRIETLIVAGFTTNVCVDATVRSAFSKGFHIMLVKELVATIKQNAHLHESTLATLGWNFAYLVEDIEELLSNLVDI